MSELTRKRAFSLIELSIVILIIGVLIAAVGQGVELLQDARISGARMLTQSSRVASIKGLSLWLEATSENSFAAAEAVDGLTISSWNDINPQMTTKNNAAQGGGAATKPTYVANGMNNLPVVRFDGANNYLTFDGSFLVNSDYTIFVIEQRDSVSASNFNHFISGTTNDTNKNLILGYQSDGLSVLQAHFSYDISYAVPAFNGKIPRMHSFRFSTADGKKYWANGGTTTDASDATQTLALTSYSGPSIGRLTFGGTNYFYKGDIAEIIMFSRALSTKERNGVEAYLSKKWGIKII